MKTNSRDYLLASLIPFAGMVLTARVMKLLLSLTALDFAAAELIAFLTATAVGVGLMLPKPFSSAAERAETDEEPGPLLPCRFPIALLYAAFALGTVILVQYALPHLISRKFEVTPALGVLSVLSIAVIHPLVEEWLFRGKIYGRLRRMNPIFGCLVQAVMAALMHTTVDGVVFALFAGILFGFVTEKTGRLWPSLAAHSLIGVRYLLTLGGVRQAALWTLDTALAIAGCAAAVALLVWRASAAKAEPDGQNGEETET